MKALGILFSLWTIGYLAAMIFGTLPTAPLFLLIAMSVVFLYLGGKK